MIIKYEKDENVVTPTGTSKKWTECPEKDATRIHYCRHDEGLPCNTISK